MPHPNNPPQGPHPAGLWPIAAAAGVVVIVLIVQLFFHLHPWLVKETGTAAPDFTLTDQQGRAVSLRQLQGKVVVLDFLTPNQAALSIHSLDQAMHLLGRGARDVVLVGIEPAPAGQSFAPPQARNGWIMLTGSPDQLARLQQAYTATAASGPNLWLIDANGFERGQFPTPVRYGDVGNQALLLARAIGRVLPTGSTMPPGITPPPHEQLLLPTASLNWKALGTAQTVAFGPAHPHLIVFFATWSAASLSRQLAALDVYGDAARPRNWPTPVAVDVLPAEFSPAGAASLLLPLTANLRTPVVEDTDGRFADGYGAGPLPWIALVSPTGAIAWSHAGWLPAPLLEKAVAAALAHPPSPTRRGRPSR